MDIGTFLQQRYGLSLSRQQREAVEATGGHILLLAVPGAGKTTVVTARLAHLVFSRGTDPHRIITLTFNRESARDMTRRWEALFGELLPVPPAISTIHSFCYGLLREYARGRGTRLPTLLEGGQGAGNKNKIITAVYREVTGSFLTEERLTELSNAMGYCVNMHLGDKEVERMGEAVPDLVPVYRRYTAYKREQGLMDFDDMLLFAHSALTRSGELRDRVRGRYDHIQVDEAQDTSKIQHEILSAIVGENLLMVGDEDQSIYGFRGAFPQGVTGFFNTYPGGRLMRLEENYRSTGAIVEAASKVIGTSQSRFPKGMTTSHPRGGEVEVVRELSLEDEWAFIARRLETLPEGETCAVLYRAGFTGIGLAHTLKQKGIAYSARQSGLRFASDFICRDILSIMSLAGNPGDKQAFGRCYFRLGCGISRETAARAMEAPRRDILDWIIETDDFPGKNTGRLSWTRRMLGKMSRAAPAKQLDMILYDLEYLLTLEKRGQGGYQMSGCMQKLIILRQLAACAGDLPEFAALVGGADRLLDARDSDFVFLSTVHSAKGQEFDRVIIADALEGIFPITDAVEYSALGQEDLVEEETRLFYTAMTRAKTHLSILAPRTAWGRNLTPSRFLRVLLPGSVLAGGVMMEAGQRVSHANFGMGEVIHVDARRGVAAVRFRVGGKKDFVLESFEDEKIFRFI